MVDTPVQLIVGLGNPGNEYDRTRHNAGFWFIDEVAKHNNAILKLEKKFHGYVAKAVINGHDVYLLKPETFMNRSGVSVAALSRFYKIPPEAIFVAHDELDFPAGKIRLKKGGGHGGHNGLRDIIAKCGSKDFMRLRIGVGHPGSSERVTGHVLGKAPADEQRLIDLTIDLASRVVPQLASGEIEAATRRLHSERIE